MALTKGKIAIPDEIPHWIYTGNKKIRVLVRMLNNPVTGVYHLSG